MLVKSALFTSLPSLFPCIVGGLQTPDPTPSSEMIPIPRMPLVLLLLLLILGSAKAQVNPGNTATTQLGAEDQVLAHTSASGYLRKSSAKKTPLSVLPVW